MKKSVFHGLENEKRPFQELYFTNLALFSLGRAQQAGIAVAHQDVCASYCI